MCQEAELAREKTNGYNLDKSPIFAVNMFDAFEKYMKVPAEWAPAEIKPYTPGVCTLPPTHPPTHNVASLHYDRFHVTWVLYVCVLQENLLKWLSDDKARDQFVIRAGTFTEVYWNDARRAMPELVYQKQVLHFFIYLLLLVFLENGN